MSNDFEANAEAFFKSPQIPNKSASISTLPINNSVIIPRKQLYQDDNRFQNLQQSAYLEQRNPNYVRDSLDTMKSQFNTKNQYALELEAQMRERKEREFNQKNIERQIENKLLMHDEDKMSYNQMYGGEFQNRRNPNFRSEENLNRVRFNSNVIVNQPTPPMNGLRDSQPTNQTVNYNQSQHMNYNASQAYNPALNNFNQPMPIQNNQLNNNGMPLLLYDENDNDINRRVNKQMNLENHIELNLSMHSAVNEKRDKLRKQHQNLTVQKALLDQMEEKKQKKIEMDKLRVIEERKEEERIKRENEEMDRKAAEEIKSKQDNLKKQYEFNQKLANDRFQNNGIHVMAKGKRVRTPVEEAEKRYKENVNLEKQIKIEERIIRELPVEVQKSIRTTMDLELEKLKREMNYQQSQLKDQILNLRQQAIELDDDRRRAVKSVENLKGEILRTQFVEEVRTRELFEALAKNHLKSILPSSSTFNEPEMLYGYPKKPYYKNYYMGERKIVDDPLFQRESFVPLDDIPWQSEKDEYLKGFKHKGSNLMDEDMIYSNPVLSDKNLFYVDKVYLRNKERDDALDDLINPRAPYKKLDSALLEFIEKDVNRDENVNKFDEQMKYINQHIAEDSEADKILMKLNNPRKYLYA